MINWRVFHPMQDLMPIYGRQAALLCQAAERLCKMQDTLDSVQWKSLYQEIRNLEHQGDALLTEFREQIAHTLLRVGLRRELTSVAMSMDDALDVVKDAANAVLIYQPAKVDSQLKELARLILEEAKALQVLLPLLNAIRKNATAITLQADRITEQEHDADEAYESYVGYIFAQEENLREMTKYKNLAELYEKATDSEKHVADCVRILLMRFA